MARLVLKFRSWNKRRDVHDRLDFTRTGSRDLTEGLKTAFVLIYAAGLLTMLGVSSIAAI
jgi:hypothetical protein